MLLNKQNLQGSKSDGFFVIEIFFFALARPWQFESTWNFLPFGVWIQTFDGRGRGMAGGVMSAALDVTTMRLCGVDGAGPCGCHPQKGSWLSDLSRVLVGLKPLYCFYVFSAVV